ncbi:MAG: AI-2E family transporter, partial [Nitrospinae bacterium]|nr:AI-2E family transporter [Nitrospinota bacterium]
MSQDKNKNLFLISLILFFVACFLLYFSRRVIAPFLIAFALAYLLDPLVDRMSSSKRVSRTASVLFLMGAFFVLLVFAGIFLIP